MLDLGIVIVNWNTRDLLRDCLRSVEQSEGVSYRVVVVDNASNDGSAEMVRAEFPDVALIANAGNRGYPAANNQGLRLLGFERRGSDEAPRYALALNPDTVLPPDALRDMVAYMDADPCVGAAGPKLVLPDGSGPGMPPQLPDARSELLPHGRAVEAVSAQQAVWPL